MKLWRCSTRRALVLMLSFLPSYRHHVVVAELSSSDISSFPLEEQHPIPKLISTFVVLPLRQPLSAKHHTTKQSSNHAAGAIRLEFWKRAKGDHEIIDDNLSKGMNFGPLDDESYDNQSTSPEIEIGSMSDDADADLGSVPTIHSNFTDTSGSNTNLSSVAIYNDSSTTSTKRNRWKRLSIPRGVEALLPGRPLVMRLVSIKSIDVMSKILGEIQPQNDKANWFELLEQERIKEQHLNSSDVSLISFDHDTHPISGRSKRRRFFQRNNKSTSNATVKDAPQLSKEELECPFVATNVDDLQTAVLVKKIPLREVGFRFPIKGVESELIFGQRNAGDERIRSNDNPINTFQKYDPIINGSLSSLLTHEAKTSSDPTLLAKYQHGIELLSYHPVLSLVRERVLTKSKPGRRLQGSSSPSIDTPHLALVIEGGGMRGAVSAGMAAALSTLDLLDAFDSIHGSSAGSIVGAYLVSRQLCMDVYTDVMPAAGKKFVSRRGGMLNFGVDWLSDLIQRKLLSSDDELDGSQGTDELCVDESDTDGENGTSWKCEEDDASSVELAMGTIKRKRLGASPRRTRLRPDDQYGGIIVESMNHLLSNMFHVTKLSISKPLSFGARRLGRALRPAMSALDVVSSMRQYLRRRPGMNITYVLDGIMDESHGLRPFDVDAFRANDKLQPLYIIASTVSNGGKGEMETGKLNNCVTFCNVTPECRRISNFL